MWLFFTKMSFILSKILTVQQLPDHMIPIYPLKICGTWFNLFLYINGKIKWPLFKKNENDRSQGLSLRFSKIKRKLLLEAGWMVWRKFLQILNLCNFSWYYYLLGYILQGSCRFWLIIQTREIFLQANISAYESLIKHWDLPRWLLVCLILILTLTLYLKILSIPSLDPHGADIPSSDGKRSIKLKLWHFIKVCIRTLCVGF